MANKGLGKTLDRNDQTTNLVLRMVWITDQHAAVNILQNGRPGGGLGMNVRTLHLPTVKQYMVVVSHVCVCVSQCMMHVGVNALLVCK